MAEKKTTKKKAAAKETAPQGTVYTVPLTKVYGKPRPKRAPKAMNVIRAFLKKHTRATEDTIKLSPPLNQEVWSRGIEHVPRKVQIRVIKDGNRVNAFLASEKIAAPAAVEKKEAKVEKTAAESAEVKAKQDEKKAKEKAVEKAAIKRGN